MLDVTFLGPGGGVRRIIQIESGENLREAAIRHKLGIYPHIFKILNCRGRGKCISCTVEIESGEVDPRNEVEEKQLKKKIGKSPNIRLACQVTVKDNLVVKTRTHI